MREHAHKDITRPKTEKKYKVHKREKRKRRNLGFERYFLSPIEHTVLIRLINLIAHNADIVQQEKRNASSWKIERG